MIDGLPLSFFFLLVVHSLAGLSTGVTGLMSFRMPKRRECHPRWGTGYLWAYTIVFLTATILSAERWEADTYLFFLALIGYGFALGGYGARRFRQEPLVQRIVGKQGVAAHIVGMIGSYIVLWTAFYVDNAHLIPQLVFWLLPTVIGLTFIMLSLSRFVPNLAASSRRQKRERKEERI